jgi:hypothetical protein
MPTELPKRRQDSPRRQALAVVLIRVFLERALLKLTLAREWLAAKRRRPRR